MSTALTAQTVTPSQQPAQAPSNAVVMTIFDLINDMQKSSGKSMPITASSELVATAKAPIATTSGDRIDANPLRTVLVSEQQRNDLSTAIPTTERTAEAPKQQRAEPTNALAPTLMSENSVLTDTKSTPQAASESCKNLAEHKAIIDRLYEGKITADGLRSAFNDFRAHREEITAAIGAFTTKQIMATGDDRPESIRHLSYPMRSGTKKGDIVKRLVDDITSSFIPPKGGMVSYQRDMYESTDDAVARRLATVTDAEIAKSVDEAKSRDAAHQKALTNPETLSEFHTFEAYRKGGERELTDEQLARYDTLRATDAVTRRNAAKAAEQREALREAAEAGATTAMAITPGTHTKRNVPIWTVKPHERLERDAYKALSDAAKVHGGHWSSWGPKEQHGFIFFDERAAKRFAGVPEDGAEGGFTPRPVKDTLGQAAAKRLAAAEDEINRPRQTNTHRRAEHAAMAEREAKRDLALAKTAQNIADAQQQGKTSWLTGVKAMTHVELLEKVAKDAVYQGIDWKSNEPDAHRRAPELSDVRNARYPYPRGWASDFKKLGNEASTLPGSKLAGNRLVKWVEQVEAKAASRHPGKPIEDVRLVFRGADMIEDLRTCAGSGIKRYLGWVKDDLANYDRAQAMGITNLPEMRCALREYIPMREQPDAPNKIKEMERALVGRDIPGFFPTPMPIVDQMLDVADIQPGMRVLEPSAGKGDIVEAIGRRHPIAGETPKPDAVHTTALEINPGLADIVRARGSASEVHTSDFLTWTPEQGRFDRILMNPPFEAGQDAKHVQHAYNLLQPGGRLVAIMSEGPFYRQQKSDEDFRSWLKEVNGSSEPLPEGSFATADAFRKTGVATRMVTIERPGT